MLMSRRERGRAWPSATARSLAGRRGREAGRERPPPRRAGAERRSARHHAVPDGGRADARSRHHEPGQSGAWLALYAWRLFRRLAAAMDRLLRARRACRRAAHRRDRYRDRNGDAAHALRPRPSRPGALHLRSHSLSQRDGAHNLGRPAAAHVAAVRGAFIAALLVGLLDTFGRILLPPALADIGIYVLMAAILFWRPRGLFPAHG